MYKEITACRCCGSTSLFKYLDLGEQPLANSYHKGEELPRFPLEVMLCEQCFHSQLSVVVEPALMFQHYLYVSGTTHTFRKHCEELAQDAVSRSWVKTPRVLDIACNDGSLLGIFKYLGCEVQGVDPAENLRILSEEKNIPVLVDYWGEGIAAKLGEKFDIITGTNVFAHVNDIQTFLNECVEALADHGTIVLEFPYCTEMITACEFDTIYHEHLSYFLVNSFKTIAERCGLSIHDVKLTKIHGGSIRFYLQRGTEHVWKVQDLIEQEQAKGLLNKSTYISFAVQVNENKRDMVALLENLRKKGKKVVGYGASAKGNTMLNYFGIDLDYIVDDNQMKWDYLTPGRNIPIKSTTVLKEDPELCVVILSWNFWDEIVRKVASIRGVDGKNATWFIRYVPKVEVA